MTRCTLSSIRLQLATELEVLSGAARIEAAREACTRTGGTFTAPNLCGDWGSHWAEISLLGITYQGNDEEHAVAGWISAVIRVANAIEEEVAPLSASAVQLPAGQRAPSVERALA